jgi:hypothetical protein
MEKIFEEKIELFNKGFLFQIFKENEEYKIFINDIGSDSFKNKDEFEKQKEEYLKKLKEQLYFNETEIKTIESRIKFYLSNIFGERSELIFEDKEKGEVYIFKASDGLITSPCSFYIEEKNKAILGELTYLYADILTKKGKDELITPSLVLAYYENGEIVKKEIKPLRKVRYLEIDGKPIKFDKKTIAENPLNTLMSLEAIEKLFKGEKVDLKEIYLKDKERTERFVNFCFNPILSDIKVCWDISTYFFDLYFAFPIAYIYGVFESGKTKLLKCMLYASHKGFLVIDPKEAGVFRTIEAFKPTLGIDEFQKVIEEIEKIIRSSYKKGERIPRIEKMRKETFYLRLFETYSPCVIASTEMIKEMFLSRCIMFLMEKADSSKLIDRDPEPFDFEDIRDDLYIARFLYAPLVYKTYNNLDIPIYGRSREIWKPILTIAKLIDEELYNRILEYAISYTEKQKEEYYQEEKQVLEAIERLFQEQNSEEISFTSSEVVKALKTILVDEKEELSSTRFDKYYTTHKIGKIISRMGIRKKRIGEKGNRAKFMTLKELEEFKKKFGMTDISDISDISFRDKAIISEESKKETLSKIEEKAENNQVLEGIQKEAKKESIGLSQKQMSDMSEMSESYKGVCEMCGSNKEVFFIRVKHLNNKKIAICQKCLMDMKKDQYEIINESESNVRSEGIEIKEKQETEDYLIFSNKISKEKFGNVEFYVCKAILKKEIDKEGKEKITYCNFRTITFEDMLNHLKTHKGKEQK